MIVTACGFAEALRGFAKDNVTYEMAIGIVDLLEMVQVGKEDRERLMASFSP